MANSKVQLADGSVLIDLTSDTVTATALRSGYTAHDAAGNPVNGALEVDPVYSITKTLTNVTSSNDDTKVIAGGSFYADLTPTSGYTITNVTVTMGGVDVTEQVFKPGVGGKGITANGVYSASDDSLSGYDRLVVNVIPELQSKTVNYTPSSSEQTDTVIADVGYAGLSSVDVTVDPIPSEYVIPSGTKTITENGLGIDVSEYESVDVTVSSGSGPLYATGTYTPAETYAATGNRVITTISEIGFTPNRFILRVVDKIPLSGIQYAILYSVFEESLPLRVTARYTNTSNTSGASPYQSSWTTQTNGMLYFASSTVYYRTTSQFKLIGGAEYIWEAYG